MKIKKENQQFVAELLYMGFEIWDGDCAYRLLCDHTGDKQFAVCNSNDPLHPIKTYQTLKSALKFMDGDADIE